MQLLLKVKLLQLDLKRCKVRIRRSNLPADLTDLTNTLAAMKATYLADPVAAVRSQRFIKHLHEYCTRELERVGFDREQIKTEESILGSHKAKRVDIAVVDPANGPLVVIGVRSQMSSISKNILTYYEEIIGDVISLHDRFPMTVIGYVYILPTRPIKPGLEGEITDLNRAQMLYSFITERGDWRNTKDKYEKFAFLRVDFTNDPPTLQKTLPQLEIAPYFDDIAEIYNLRNYTIAI